MIHIITIIIVYPSSSAPEVVLAPLDVAEQEPGAGQNHQQGEREHDEVERLRVGKG